MAEFKRDPAREAAAIARGTITKEELERRGGINASGYYGDSYDPNTSLSDEEYAAAIAGKTGVDVGRAINAAVEKKVAAYNATLPKKASVTTGSGVSGNTVVNTGTNPLNTTVADEKLAKRKSAYDTLYEEFNKYGLGSLVSDIKNYLIDNTFDTSEFSIQLQNTKAYQNRFSANKERIAKGLSALRPAEYIALEDQYQNVMRNYGLPESYWKQTVDPVTGITSQEGFKQLIANDVDNIELEDRIMTAQNRVVNANPEVLQAIKAFYPDIKNGDILAYVLDPANARDAIKRKVTAAEIGGAAIQAGLQTGLTRAEQLQAAGVTKDTAQQGYGTIAGGLQRGSQLASIYGEDPYTQTTAETEVFNIAGAQEAAKQRKKLTGLEKATFSGQSGISSGALARDRAGAY